MFKIYKKEDEVPVNKDGQFPYSILPKGYPYKIGSKKIKETIQYFLDHIKATLDKNNPFYNIERDISFIELGRNELDSRVVRKRFLVNLIISITAVTISLIALFGK